MTLASVLLRRGATAFPAARTRFSSALASSLPAPSAASVAHLPTNARSSPLVHAPSSSPSSFQHRSVFTYPAPRKLTDIMKVPLVRKCEPVEIKEMWQEYHKERRDALASTIPAQQFKILKDRAKASRVFLYPVFRESGYMTLISQFQDSCFLFTFLGMGAELCSLVMESEAFDYLDAPPERVTGADVPMPYAINLEKAALPQIEDIVTAVKRTTYRKKQ